MSTSLPTAKPALATFLQGFGSGAFNGALMALVFAGLTFAFAGGLPAVLALGTNFGLMIPATGIFGGIMATRRAHQENHSARHVSHEIMPDAIPATDSAPELTPAPTKWADRTGRSETSPSRIQQILNDGALSDKARATAILAERETDKSAERG